MRVSPLEILGNPTPIHVITRITICHESLLIYSRWTEWLAALNWTTLWHHDVRLDCEACVTCRLTYRWWFTQQRNLTSSRMRCMSLAVLLHQINCSKLVLTLVDYLFDLRRECFLIAAFMRILAGCYTDLNGFKLWLTPCLPIQIWTTSIAAFSLSNLTRLIGQGETNFLTFASQPKSTQLSVWAMLTEHWALPFCLFPPNKLHGWSYDLVSLIASRIASLITGIR